MTDLLIPILVIQVAHFVCSRLESRRLWAAALARNPAEFKHLTAKKGVVQ